MAEAQIIHTLLDHAPACFRAMRGGGLVALEGTMTMYRLAQEALDESIPATDRVAALRALAIAAGKGDQEAAMLRDAVWECLPRDPSEGG